MKRANVLIVEDDRPSLEVVTRILAGRGHSVTGAGSAEEALAALDGASFDIVLLDLVLPGMTGLQALAEIKRRTAADVHLMSGQTDEDTRQDALLLGAASFLPKPLDLKTVAALVDAA